MANFSWRGVYRLPQMNSTGHNMKPFRMAPPHVKVIKFNCGDSTSDEVVSPALSTDLPKGNLLGVVAGTGDRHVTMNTYRFSSFVWPSPVEA